MWKQFYPGEEDENYKTINKSKFDSEDTREICEIIW